MKRFKIISFFFFIVFFILPSSAKESFSNKEIEKLNELNKISIPKTSIFGELENPLRANISIFDIMPQIINYPLFETKLENVKNEPLSEPIKLAKKENKDVNVLNNKRKELQKSEVSGLNFIQPSLELTKEEQSAIDEFFSRSEQEQLVNLWKATIERNKTIQFIVTKLTPTNSAQEKNSLLSKTIGAAIFLPFYAIQAFTNNSGAYFGSQLGGRVLGSVIDGKMQKNQAQMQLTQTEGIILFMMIDEVAERLRSRYHNYKKLIVDRMLANQDLEEAKKDALDARDLKSEEALILASIERRALEREIRKIDADIRSNKNVLIELAGEDAIKDLDMQLRIETAAALNTPLEWRGGE